MAKKVASSTKGKGSTVTAETPGPASAKPAGHAKSDSGATLAVATKAARKQSAEVPSAASAKPKAATTVTLKHLAAGLAEKHDLPKKLADTLLADMVGLVLDHLKTGERVRIGGLGLIEIKNRPARMGRNPATGEVIQIAASRKVAFRAAKELKAAV